MKNRANIKKFLSGMITGGLITAASFLLISKQHVTLEEVKVTQISGDKISHANFDYAKEDCITFTTVAEGRGVIETKIPKSNIREAASWKQKNNSMQMELMLNRNRIGIVPIAISF